MILKHVKLFEELSPSLANRASKKSIENGSNYYGVGDEYLEYQKILKQQKKFSNYETPEIKEKFKESGFGYFHKDNEYFITWSNNKIDDIHFNSKVMIRVNKDNYKVVKGQLNEIPDQQQRRLIKLIPWLQNQL